MFLLSFLVFRNIMLQVASREIIILNYKIGTTCKGVNWRYNVTSWFRGLRKRQNFSISKAD